MQSGHDPRPATGDQNKAGSRSKPVKNMIAGYESGHNAQELMTSQQFSLAEL